MSDSVALLQTNIIMGLILNFVLFGFASALPETLRKSQRMWAVAGMFITLSWIALALRAVFPTSWTTVFANAFLGFGLAFYGNALCEFMERPLGIGVALLSAGAFALFTVAAFYFEVSGVWRFVGLAIGSMIVFAWVAKLAFDARKKAFYGASFTLGVLISILIAQAIRAVYFAKNSHMSFQELLFSPGSQFITVTATASFALLTFSFSMMTSERLTSQLRKLVRFDNLTHSLNRNPWRHSFQGIFETKRAQALMLFDLDHFKEVNDKYGHAAGDFVLQTVARQAAEQFGESVGRLGGEEFTVYFAALDQADALRIAEKFRSIVCAQPIIFAEQSIKVSISVGLVWLADYQSVKDALTAADRAMYQAKRDGRNRCATAANQSRIA